ncbi:dsRBD fold-containing protein [Georgenia sp. SUBG003]|uniref:dsRBD fold-containing protein n=1 Tax=Georgenia sp. SUBG003 TaxID=1497974 RepID=UPI003AB910EF
MRTRGETTGQPEAAGGDGGTAARVEHPGVAVRAGGRHDGAGVLVSGPAEQTDASGTAHRSARDPASPRIGDEIAVARALRHLSDKLFERARHDVEEATGEHDVDIRVS